MEIEQVPERSPAGQVSKEEMRLRAERGKPNHPNAVPGCRECQGTGITSDADGVQIYCGCLYDISYPY